MKKYKLFTPLLALVLAVFLLLSCAGCKQKTQLDYTFYGAWFVDGQLGDETYTFSIEGQIPTNIQTEQSDWVETQSEFYVYLPEDFPYYFGNISESDCIIYRSSSVPCPTHYYFLAQAYNRNSSSADLEAFSAPTEIHLCPQEEYIIIGFFREPGKYLVGTTDANASLEEVVEHFSFVHTSPYEE